MITIYSPTEDDFSTYGLGILYPNTCKISEIAGGKYELTMEHPIDDDQRWTLIGPECIIRAPAPLRESPVYEADAFAESAPAVVPVTRGLYKVKDKKTAKLYKKKSTSSKKLKELKSGAEVTRVAVSGKWMQVVDREGGKTGWVRSNTFLYVQDVTDNVTKTQTITRNGIRVVPSRDQFFRVKIIEPDTEQGIITVTATQIFYDLHGNLINIPWEAEDVNAAAAVDYMAAHLLNTQDDFDYVCYDTEGKATGDWSYKSPVEMLLDPDEGLIAQTGDMIIRDGWDVYILPGSPRDTGVTVRRGKNLIGVTTNTDLSDVVTRIIPVGKNKRGDDLLLAGPIYVDSPRIGDYPLIYAKRQSYDVSIVDKDADYDNKTTFRDTARARAKLQELAQKDFDDGCDQADYSMEVDFAYLQYAEGYEDYAALQSVHLYDTVTVIDELIGLNAKTRVVEYEWDCLTEQYTKIVLGDIQSVKPSVFSYNLPSGGIKGSKIAVNSLTGDRMAPDSIFARNIRAGAVEATHVDADTLTANTAVVQTLNARAIDATAAKIGSITSTSIRTDALAAAFASLFSVVADNISARTITADALDAVIESVVTLTAGSADFDVNTVRHLVSSVLSVTHLNGGMALIENLYVTNANLVNATLDALTVKGSDDNYYDIAVGSDGVLSATLREVSQAEIDAGETTDGRGIVGDIDLDVVGEDGLDGKYLRDAETGLMTLYASALSAGHITATTAFIGSGQIPSLETTAVKALGDSIDISANRSIVLQADSLRRVARLDAEGLHVGAAEIVDDQPVPTGSEVLIDDSSVNVVLSGVRYSRFAADYAQFGDYQLRRSVDGGLVFKRQ